MAGRSRAVDDARARAGRSLTLEPLLVWALGQTRRGRCAGESESESAGAGAGADAGADGGGGGADRRAGRRDTQTVQTAQETLLPARVVWRAGQEIPLFAVCAEACLRYGPWTAGPAGCGLRAASRAKQLRINAAWQALSRVERPRGQMLRSNFSDLQRCTQLHG